MRGRLNLGGVQRDRLPVPVRTRDEMEDGVRSDRGAAPAVERNRALVSIQLEGSEDSPTFASLSGQGLRRYSAALTKCWSQLNLRPGDVVGIYDYGSSPVTYLASRLYVPYLDRGPAERFGCIVACNDGGAEQSGRAVRLAQFLRPKALFVRLDCLRPMLRELESTGVRLAEVCSHLIVQGNGRWLPGDARAMLEERLAIPVTRLIRLDEALFLSSECRLCNAFHASPRSYSLAVLDGLSRTRKRPGEPGVLAVRPRFTSSYPCEYFLTGIHCALDTGVCPNGPEDQRFFLGSAAASFHGWSPVSTGIKTSDQAEPKGRPRRAVGGDAQLLRERVFFDARETWSLEQVRAYQLRKLRQVSRYAYDHLPFYRELWDRAGVRPAAIRSLEDLALIPIFNKKDVLREIAKARGGLGLDSSPSPQGTSYILTSGTLGNVFLQQSWPYIKKNGDSVLRAYWWAGLRPGMRMFVASLAWHTLGLVERDIVQRMGVSSVTPWGSVHPAFAANWVDVLRSTRPEFVSMPAHMLSPMLLEASRRGLVPQAIFEGVQYVMLHGSPITSFFRTSLVRDLGVRDVYDSAGNPEGLRAVECSQHNGHHLFVDLCHVEIVDPLTRKPLPPGTRGNVVVTSFLQHGSIFIRYDTEDVGGLLPSACPCGRTWPLLTLYGRRTESVRVAGRDVHAYDVRIAVDQVEGLAGLSLAFIEEPDGQVIHLVVQHPPSGDVARKEEQLKALVRDRLRLESRIEWVAALRSEKTVQILRPQERADG